VVIARSSRPNKQRALKPNVIFTFS
jgi:hypothetical protein